LRRREAAAIMRVTLAVGFGEMRGMKKMNVLLHVLTRAVRAAARIG